MHTRFSRLFPAIAGALLLATLTVTGCSSDKAPTASRAPSASVVAFEDAGDAPAVFGFQGTPLPGAGKTTGILGSSGPFDDAADIGPAGGQVAIADGAGDGRIAVTFSTPAGALDASAYITMSVTGYNLSEVLCTFGPAGLIFNPWSSLRIELGADRIDLDLSTIVGVHAHDGTSELMQVTVDYLPDGGAAITLDVPGFSRYSLGE